MEESNNTISTINRAMNQYNLLQIRLSTDTIIDQAKMFLNSEIEVINQDANGDVRREIISIGVPKANKRGTASILNWIQMVVNPQVVQGNFPEDGKGKTSTMYDNYIEECQKDLMDLLMINIYKYDIDEDEIQGIVDAMMNLIKPYMTRLIGNKERESYGETFKEISSTQLRDKGRIPFQT